MLLFAVPEFTGTLQNKEKIEFEYWLLRVKRNLSKGCWDVPLAAQLWQSLRCLLLPSSHWYPCPAPAPWKGLQPPYLATVSHILLTIFFLFPMVFPAILFALYTVTSETSPKCELSLQYLCNPWVWLSKDHPEVLFCEQWTVCDNCSSDQISLQYWCARFSGFLLALLPHFYPHYGFSSLGFLAQMQFPWLGYSTTALPITLAPTPLRLSSAFLFLFLEHSVHCINL